jgi:hypothetical protein
MDVVQVRANMKMGWVDTRRVVTGMKHMSAIRDAAMRDGIGEPRRQFWFSERAELEPAVALLVCPGEPGPTFVRPTDVDIPPEAFKDRPLPVSRGTFSATEAALAKLHLAAPGQERASTMGACYFDVGSGRL